jgi:hypothetical protein
VLEVRSGGGKEERRFVMSETIEVLDGLEREVECREVFVEVSKASQDKLPEGVAEIVG